MYPLCDILGILILLSAAKNQLTCDTLDTCVTLFKMVFVACFDNVT